MPAENHKPQGKELKVARHICRLLDKYRKIKGYDHSPTVFIGHVIDGVRCNGHERVSSLLRVIKEMESYEQNLKIHIEGHRKALLLTEEIRELLTAFKVCPECKGEQGSWDGISDTYSCRLGHWVDCTNCDGRGILDA